MPFECLYIFFLLKQVTKHKSIHLALYIFVLVVEIREEYLTTMASTRIDVRKLLALCFTHIVVIHNNKEWNIDGEGGWKATIVGQEDKCIAIATTVAGAFTTFSSTSTTIVAASSSANAGDNDKGSCRGNEVGASEQDQESRESQSMLVGAGHCDYVWVW